jgi:hypothetical protein
MLQIIFQTLMADFHIQVNASFTMSTVTLFFSYHKASEVFFAAYDGTCFCSSPFLQAKRSQAPL